MSEPVTTTHLLEEISRQRAHIKDLQKLVTELAEKAATEREECDRLAAENEKLREALEGLLSYTRACEDLLNVTESLQCKIARAAIAKARIG